MQSKGAIQFFAIVLTLVCIYQLSFTWFARNVENDAREFANDDPLKERAYLDSMASEPVYDLLIKEYTYKECKDRELNLGLDLKGGMNVTLEVSVVDVIRSMANYSTDTTFVRALTLTRELQKESQEDFVTLFGRAFESIDPNAKLAAIFATRENQDKIKYNSTNEEVLEVIRKEANDAIDRSFNILRARIDKFGVSQPNIQKLGTAGRILVELPGVKEPDRIRKLLQGTAKLEFWETYENREIYPNLAEANELLRILTGKGKTDTIKSDTLTDSAPLTTSPLDTSEKPSEGLTLLEKFGGDTLSPDDTLSAEENLAAFANENPLFSILRPALFQDETGNYQYADGPVIGYVAIKDTGKINKCLSKKQVRSLFPRDFKYLWTAKPYDEEGKGVQLVAIKVSSRDGRAPLEGNVITDARQDYEQFTGSPEITMSMDGEGTKIWKRLTSENIDKSIAIVLDDYVYSFPTVKGEIPNGRSSISGNFSINEAKDLANILKAGKLPAPARIVEEAIVGPSLGQEAIDDGLMSFIVALIIVLLYMMFYYSSAGIVANIALLVNIFFIMGVLASLGAALTLPGIAGIVLTIGMSIDANVLIFERIREEVTAGKGMRLAITDGYNRAYSSIIDANVTTLLVAIILYMTGTGPIKGFATTLIIGILTSLFSAIFITRLIFIWRSDANKPISFATKITEGAFKNLNIQFLKNRKLFYGISTVIILGGIVSLSTRGLNYGVDFTGGRSYVVRFKEDVNTQKIRDALKIVFESAPEVKTFGPSNQVKITTKYLIDDDSKDVDETVKSKLEEGLSTFANATAGKFEIMSSQKVGPTIADDIKRGAVWATILCLIAIFLYILMRFRKWQFGLGALVALFHDVLLVLSCFSILHGIVPFSLEMDQAFIAALLTVIGYSINDTVVVFDRIREHMGLYKKRETEDIMNTALNSTLSRTFNTSLSTFCVLLVIFILGGEVIRGFSFAMLIGVVVGTYSSLFIATPVVLDTFKKQKKF